MSDSLWEEADLLLFRRNRARAAAQSALEQRFANPEDMVLADMLESMIRDVHAIHRAWADCLREGNHGRSR